jgi:hypothetical protein
MNEIPARQEETELLLLLGTMVRDAAHLEVIVESLASHLVAENPQAPTVRGLPLSLIVRKCREAAGTVPRVDTAQRSGLDGLLDRVEKVAGHRNAYVHGAWVQDDDGEYIGVRGKRGQAELITNAVSSEQLLEMIEEIRAILNGLMEWLSRDLDILYGPVTKEVLE